MLRARERTPTPFPSTVFTFGLAVESIKELGGASSMKMMKHPTRRTCWSSMTTRQNQHENSSRKGKKKATNQTYMKGVHNVTKLGLK
jgi:hypothetical protein